MTRDEAIGRIKARFDKWALDDEDMKAIQTLIPELAESEGERIKKTIRQLLETARDAHSNTTLAKPFIDALAWLEKQKEQKPAECITDEEMKQSRDALHDFKVFATDLAKQLNINIDHRRDIDWDNFCAGLLTYLERNKPAEWSEEDEKKLERVDDLLWMLDDYISDDCSICEERTARLRDEIHNELFPWLEFLRPQYHEDVTMTEAYKMGLEAGKASSWKPSEKQTNNVIVELTRIELGDIINGLYYLKEKYYEDCKEHNGTATMGLSDEFKFYFKRFNEVLDLYTRLHELEKEKYGTTTDGYYYE